MTVFTIPFKKALEYKGVTVTYNELVIGEVKCGLIPVMNDPARIGLAHYPIYKEEYRQVLNGKILDQFWNREIGFETVELFQMAIRRKMNLIMPYFNKLYDSELLVTDPLSTMDIHTVSVSEGEEVTDVTGNSTTSNDTRSDSRAVQSSTPQTMLSGNEDYATGAADSNSTTNVDTETLQDTNQNSQTNNNSDTRVTGYQGIPANIVMRHRESLLNIDMMIINDIEDCFMQVWDNADNYTKKGWGQF